MLRINVTTAEAVITETELITSGRKGLRCAFTFSDDWAALAKTVIVQGAATRDIALLATNEITVPAECVNKAQFPLKIGVYGARPDGTIAIPTIWASFGKVLPGAKPSDIPPDELTPDVVAQIQEAANNALYLARNVQSMADSGALDGVSPAVTVTSITGGHNVKITDRNHPDGQDFDVPDGQDGEDGVSPTISSTSITGGHRLSITDAGGTTTVDVMDGQDGQDGAPGVGVPSGGAAGDVLRKASGTDYDTEWHSPEIFWAVYDSTTADDIEAARIAGKAIMCAYGGRTYVMNYRQSATKFYFTASDRNSLYYLSVSGSTWSNVSTKTVGTYSKPSGGIPASDLESAVQTSLGKADTALQSAPVSSVHGQSGAVSLSIPSTAADVGAIAAPEGGSVGQVLKKTASGAEWANESGSGGGSISPYTSNPAALGTASPGVSDDYARGDHVHPLPSIPEGADEIEWTGGNLGQLTPPQTVEGAVGVVYDAIPTTASDVGAVAVSQGVAHAGEFVVVGSDGNITTVTMSVWQGGNYGS